MTRNSEKITAMRKHGATVVQRLCDQVIRDDEDEDDDVLYAGTMDQHFENHWEAKEYNIEGLRSKCKPRAQLDRERKLEREKKRAKRSTALEQQDEQSSSGVGLNVQSSSGGVLGRIASIFRGWSPTRKPPKPVVRPSSHVSWGWSPTRKPPKPVVRPSSHVSYSQPADKGTSNVADPTKTCTSADSTSGAAAPDSGNAQPSDREAKGNSNVADPTKTCTSADSTSGAAAPDSTPQTASFDALAKVSGIKTSPAQSNSTPQEDTAVSGKVQACTSLPDETHTNDCQSRIRGDDKRGSVTECVGSLASSSSAAEKRERKGSAKDDSPREDEAASATASLQAHADDRAESRSGMYNLGEASFLSHLISHANAITHRAKRSY